MESIKIEGVTRHTGIYVDTIGKDVWINVMLSNGSANLSITPGNAEKLIEAIRVAIVEASHED
jgi:hypothetical protein